MSDPNDFISFAAYLGLNPGSGDAMLDRADDEGDRLRKEAVGASEAHYNNSRGASEAEYARTGEAARKGLASYSAFMKGMQSPADRQALLEKTYGKGGVSWLDAALTGSSQRIGAGQKDVQQLTTQFEGRGIAADRRRAAYGERQAAQKTADDAYTEQRQAAADAREKDRLGRAYYDSLDDGDDTVPDESAGGLDPASWGRRRKRTGAEREMRMADVTSSWGARDNKTGKVDWDRFYGARDKHYQTSYENRTRPLLAGLPGEWSAPSSGGWSTYYNKTKRSGAK